MYPNIQAYDRGGMFSPEGKLFQVEYAKEAVKKGATSIGIIADKSVVLIAHKNITEPLLVPATVQKIFRIDQYIGATYSGLVSDGLRIIGLMRSKTQTHRMIYDETESVESIAKEVSEEMQQATQYGGLRPFGISLLIAGFDSKPRLFEVEPAAAFFGYKADAIGSGKKIAVEILEKEYKENLSSEEAIELGLRIINKINTKKTSEDNIDIGIVNKEQGYKQLTQKEILKYL
ncbi:MAG: archaeal proteasome endopeptidase complex subunit alpha [Candidatus Marsarchaeota archaeon]|nr:archaeal proteasome endopeptidase complex subunit alpha [Candidatus Marsarchaeota archaeon]